MKKKKSFGKSFWEVFKYYLIIAIIMVMVAIQPAIGYLTFKVFPTISVNPDLDKDSIYAWFIMGIGTTMLIALSIICIVSLLLFINHLVYKIQEVKMTQYMPITKEEIEKLNADSIEECIKRIIPFVYRKASYFEKWSYDSFVRIYTFNEELLEETIEELYNTKKMSYQISFLKDKVMLHKKEIIEKSKEKEITNNSSFTIVPKDVFNTQEGTK